MSRRDRVGPEVPGDLTRLVDPDLDDELVWEQVEVAGEVGGEEASEVEITESRLVEVRLVGAHLDDVRLIDVAADGCDLSGTILWTPCWIGSTSSTAGCRGCN
ncbi:MAG TPA: hypothetical protein VHA73_11255 [Acidimicrobiales bacterium]|jgi:hypothetical protein|nr:hypothetical protein [Acidimicrobiales bacterium]